MTVHGEMFLDYVMAVFQAKPALTCCHDHQSAHKNNCPDVINLPKRLVLCPVGYMQQN